MTTTFRPHGWINKQTLQPLFGIQARRDSGPWMHACSGQDALIFESEADRDKKIIDLERRVSERQS